MCYFGIWKYLILLKLTFISINLINFILFSQTKNLFFLSSCQAHSNGMLILVDFDKPFNFSRKIPEFHISYHLEIQMENYCSRCWLQSTIKKIHFRQYLWIMKKNIVHPYRKYKHIERLYEYEKTFGQRNENWMRRWMKKKTFIYPPGGIWQTDCRLRAQIDFPNTEKKQNYSQRKTPKLKTNWDLILKKIPSTNIDHHRKPYGKCTILLSIIWRNLHIDIV